jgi:DNA-binding YbaB/EbfC family protein
MTDIRSLLQMGQQMQGRLAAIQSELAQRTVTGSAGAGMVTVTADGRGQVRDIKIDPSLLAGDVEMLEELVLAAVAEVQKKAADVAQDEIRKLQSGLPFPLPFSL